MSVQLNLSTYGAELKAAYKEVVDKGCDTNWIILGYTKGANELKVCGKGDGGLDELSEEFEDDKVLFALAQVIDPNSQLPKLVFISWCGEGAPVQRKGLLPSHLGPVQKFFEGYHVQINARDSEDVTPAQIMKKIDESSGAKYSYHEQVRSQKPASQSVLSPPSSRPTPSVPSYKKSVSSTPPTSKPESPRTPSFKPPQASSSIQNRFLQQVDQADKEKLAREEQERFEREFLQKSQNKSPQSPRKVGISSRVQEARDREERELQERLEKARIGRSNIPSGKQSQKEDESFSSSKRLEEERRREAEIEAQRQSDRQQEQRRAEEASRQKEREEQMRLERENEDKARQEREERSNNEAREQERLQREQDEREQRELESRQREQSEREARQREQKELEARRREQEELEARRREQEELEARKRDQEEQETRQREQKELEAREREEKEHAARQKEQEEREEQDRKNKELQAIEAEKASSATNAAQGEPQLMAIALFDYAAIDETEVNLKEGEMVTSIQQVDEGWWEGTNESGETGLFPANYVELVAPPEPTPIQEQAPVQVEQSSSQAYAIALYDYEASEEGELSFGAADAITNIDFLSDDWWQGTNPAGQTGLFPANYVELQQ